MIRGKKLSSRRLHFFLVAHCHIFSHNQPFWLGGDAHGRGGDAQGGEGGCTCILCIPPGYATAHTGDKNRRVYKVKSVFDSVATILAMASPP